WKERIGAQYAVTIPFDRKPPDEIPFDRHCFAFEINEETSARIGSIARQFNVSVEALLLSCWQTLIWRLTNQPDITISISSDCRTAYEEIQTAMGLFTKWLPLTIQFKGALRFDELMVETFKAIREAQVWREYFVEQELDAGKDGNNLCSFGFE